MLPDPSLPKSIDVRVCPECGRFFYGAEMCDGRIGDHHDMVESVMHRYVLAEVTDEMVERAARALVYEQSQGCVSWEDTDNEITSGDSQTRGYALAHARAALVAAFSTCEACGGTRERRDRYPDGTDSNMVFPCPACSTQQTPEGTDDGR